MRCDKSRVVLLLLLAALTMPAPVRMAMAAQDVGIQWQHDLEAAKTLAKQTNRLVLVHFWTPSCGPCLTLDQVVFNQPNVAAVIEQRFVPVKLNANENSATAQGFGITRVPTDVILTADGQVVGKLISPPTPAGYIAEVTQVAAAYSATPGQAFANAAARAPMPSGLNVNAAYANLPVPVGATPAAPTFGNAPPMYLTGQPTSPIGAPQSPSNTFGPPALAPITPIGSGPAPAGAAPPATMNPLAAAPAPTANSFTSPPAAPAPAAPVPVQVDNRYAARPNYSVPPVAAQTVPALPVSQQIPQAYAPPASAAGQAPTLISGTSASTLSLRTEANASLQQPAQTPVQQQPLVQQQALQQQPAVAATRAAVSTTAAAPDAGQLPSGSPPIGFDGYCPVSMRNNWKWVPGDPRWGVVHRGRTYWFASQNEQQQFWADPDRFSPALSGMDPVMAIDHQQQVPGKREHSIDYDNLFYMFSSEATLAQFTANPERYAVSVRQAMGIPRGRLVR
jgi:YHS domain-containing protein/thiol-disulfide isomerase/thioredoxin